MASKRASAMQMALPVINGPALARAYVERSGFVSRIYRYVDRDGERVSELMMSASLAFQPDVPGHWVELFTFAAIDEHIQRARAAQAAKLARDVQTWLPGHGAVSREDPFGRMGSAPAGPRRASRRDPIEAVRRSHGK